MKFYDSSWNPFAGCTRVSPGCDRCMALENLKRQGRPVTPCLNPRAMKRGPEGETVMTCSQSDLFHEAFAKEQIKRVLGEIKKRPNIRFLATTRRDERMRDVMDGTDIPNLWLGVSVESQEHVNRVQTLLDTSGDFHRWVCLEPLIGPVDLSEVLKSGEIEWVELGAERGDGRRPCQPGWVEKVLSDCRRFNVPVLVNTLDVDGRLTDNPADWPRGLQVRQWPWENGQPRTVVMADTPGLSGKITRRADGSFLVDAPSFVYDHFSSEPMAKHYNIWFLSSRAGRTKFELVPLSRPNVEETDYLSNYTHFFWRNK